MSNDVAPQRLKLRSKPSRTADKVFFAVAKAAGYSSLVLVPAILSLVKLRAWPGYASQGVVNSIIGAG